MKRHMPFAVLALTAVLAADPAAAQEPQPAPEGNAIDKELAKKPLVPLDIQIVVSRYQGEKKVSSLPFSLAVNANDPAVSQLRMGANVPVPATFFAHKT